MTAEFTLAVHALVYLVHKGSVVSSTALAENICTNPARVRKVMSKLHKAALVESHKGQGSGYAAYPSTGQASLDAVLKALAEQPIEMSWRSGDMDQDCLVSSGMGAIMSNIYTKLNDACHRELSLITIADINDLIFHREEPQDDRSQR